MKREHWIRYAIERFGIDKAVSLPIALTLEEVRLIYKYA